MKYSLVSHDCLQQKQDLGPNIYLSEPCKGTKAGFTRPGAAPSIPSSMPTGEDGSNGTPERGGRYTKPGNRGLPGAGGKGGTTTIPEIRGCIGNPELAMEDATDQQAVFVLAQSWMI